MTPKIVRLNATSLYAMGFDRPTVEAFLNAFRVTGASTDGLTVDDLADQVNGTGQTIKDVQGQIVLLQLSTDYLDYAPPVVHTNHTASDASQLAPVHQQSMAERMENIQGEVRQLAEQIAVVMNRLQEDLLPKVDQVAAVGESLQSEVRFIAEQQVTLANTIQELKQGTML